jgi:hypothetical protein
MNDTVTIVEANGAYLRQRIMEIHSLASDYHERAGPKTHTADQITIQFFKHIDSPNTILLVPEKDGKPVGFLFGMAHERLAFLNAAYLNLKDKKEASRLKQECLARFDEWAKGLKCEQACFSTFRGPYAHKWAEKFGWECQMTVYQKNYLKEPSDGR